MQTLSKLCAAGVLTLVSFAASAADIVDTAISAGQFNTLVKAVQEAVSYTHLTLPTNSRV